MNQKFKIDNKVKVIDSLLQYNFYNMYKNKIFTVSSIESVPRGSIIGFKEILQKFHSDNLELVKPQEKLKLKDLV